MHPERFLTQSSIGFAAYVRQQVEAMLPGDKPRAIGEADRAVLDATNRYLISEGEAPLDIAAIAAVPNHLHKLLADAFDSRTLTRTSTPFNAGADVSGRIASRERNRALAQWMRALHEYYAACEGKDPYAGEALKLWKQEIIIDDAGKTSTRISEVDHIDTSEHAIVGFNGVSGMHAAQANLRGFFEQMTQMLGGEIKGLLPIGGKKLNLYAATYPDAHRLRYGQEIPAINADPETYISDHVRRFTQQVVLPWLELKEGELLSPADLKAHMRRMNLFLYSYGSAIGKEIRNALAEWLQAQGYPDAVIRLAFAESYALNVHPVSRLDESHPCGNFSSLYVVSQNDQQTRARADHTIFVPPGTEPPALIPISENELMVWLRHPTQNIAWDNPDMDAQFDEKSTAAAKVPGLAGLGSGHNLRLATQSYRYTDEAGQERAYHPAYLANSLRSVVAAAVVPGDLSRILDAPLGADEQMQPIPPSFKLKEEIRRYQAQRQERDKGIAS